ncbi:MAG: hypothetical protein WDZ51_03365 [Pirellulaceae bacterium]
MKLSDSKASDSSAARPLFSVSRFVESVLTGLGIVGLMIGTFTTSAMALAQPALVVGLIGILAFVFVGFTTRKMVLSRVTARPAK